MFKKDLPCADDCGRLVGDKGAKGRCAVCNQRVKREQRLASPLPCSVEDCTRRALRAGDDKCDMHRNRVRRHGQAGLADPLIGKRGEGTLKAGYRLMKVGNSNEGARQVGEHRLVMERVLGRPLESWENVHHRNGIRDDNRPENLELWVKPQPYGQRAEDLVAWVVEHYPDEVWSALRTLDTCE